MIELQEPEWWQQLPALIGPMLHLREVEADDVESLFELLTDPRVSQYISPPPASIRAFEGFIEWAHRRRESGTCVCFAVVPNGLKRAIGLFQLRSLEPKFRIAEWGFAMGAAFWSTGLFEEAAVLVAEFAFRTIGVHRLEARAVVDNSRGNRALEKLGAKGEAVLRKAFNREYTQFMWAIVADEWSAPPAKSRNPFDAAKVRAQIERAVARHSSAANTGPRASFSQPFPFFLTDSSADPPEEA
jgi:ribosomal-protein-alanine N-acetyltransferase